MDEYALTLDADPRAPSRGRDWATRVLRDHGLAVLAADAALVVSELLSNAVVHGRGPIELTLRLREGLAEVGVRDRGEAARIEIASMPDEGRHGGRGLPIVDAVAERVVVESDAAGTRVRALLRAG